MGDIFVSSGGKTSGPVSFMKVFSEGTNAIQQGAFRSGANMGMMSIEHPDIINFINAKNDRTAFTNFNFSAKVPDAFMRQLKENPDTQHVVINPRTKKKYIIPHSIEITSYSIDDLLPEDPTTDDCYTVKEIWDMIIKNAHATGEPGICFNDRINENNPTPHLGRIEATNPCSEQPLLFFESCNLGSKKHLKICKQETARFGLDTFNFSRRWTRMSEWYLQYTNLRYRKTITSKRLHYLQQPAKTILS